MSLSLPFFALLCSSADNFRMDAMRSWPVHKLLIALPGLVSRLVLVPVSGLVLVLSWGLLWGLLWSVLLTGCHNGENATEALPVRIAIPVQPSSALMLVARDGGFFERAGLKPAYLMHRSGKRALVESIIPGYADIASTADLPVMELIGRHDDLRVLATIQSVRSVNAVLARADRGITGFADLNDRDVGVQELSAVHFFLDRALRAHGGDPDSVRYRFAPIEELVDLLNEGAVDAISIREPFLSRGRDLMGDDAVVLDAPWVYPQFELLVTRAEYAMANQEVLTRAVQALLAAERFLYQQPDEAVTILADALAVSHDQARTVLENTINRVVVPQSVFPSLEAQLRWIGHQDDPRQDARIRSGMIVLDAFHVAPLLSLHPERVGIAGATPGAHDE